MFVIVFLDFSNFFFFWVIDGNEGMFGCFAKILKVDGTLECNVIVYYCREAIKNVVLSYSGIFILSLLFIDGCLILYYML